MSSAVAIAVMLTVNFFIVIISPQLLGIYHFSHATKTVCIDLKLHVYVNIREGQRAAVLTCGGFGRNFRAVRPVETADFRKAWKRVGIPWPM
jgi:hypothetical protein